MLDEPSSSQSNFNTTDLQVSNSPGLQAHLQEPSAQPTFVQLRKPDAADQVRWQIGVGLAGFVIIAAIGWAVVRLSSIHTTPMALEAPSRQASAFDLYPESGTPMPEVSPAAWADAGPAVPSDLLSSPAEGGVSSAFELRPLTSPPGQESETTPGAPSYETSVQLEKGDTLGSALHELGFAKVDVGNAISVLASHVNLKRLPTGQEMTLTIRRPDEATAGPILQSLAIRPEAHREITIKRDEGGDYTVEEEVFDIMPRRKRASGTVDGSVIVSAAAAGVPQAALAEMLRAFSWDVNFQHDIKVGDRFDVLVEQSWTSDGRPVDSGRVLWAELTTGGGEQSYSIYRFKPSNGVEFFYNGEGESVVKALLRTPLNLSRISSRFGMRRHPVLKFTRLHAGIDFAAPPGTPILAAGAGRVLEAGRKGGYGRWVKIRHEGGLATGYAHMSRIASGVRRSARVRQGQVIGFVGSSGLSTGPHLHFELHRHGRPINPLSMARTARRARLSGDELARFKARVIEIDQARESAAVMESE